MHVVNYFQERKKNIFDVCMSCKKDIERRLKVLHLFQNKWDIKLFKDINI